MSVKSYILLILMCEHKLQMKWEFDRFIYVYSLSLADILVKNDWLHRTEKLRSMSLEQKYRKNYKK